MDTCGPQTAAPSRLNESIRRLGRAAPWLFVLSLLGGCASEPMELGRPLPVEQLSKLKPGVSTMTEVLAALGQPQGRGGARVPALPAAEVLLYESDTMDGTKMRMKMLMVFVARDSAVYEGYMWFNSGMFLSPSN